jgi:predicted glycosyltransferase
VARFYEGLKENLYLDSWPLDRAAKRRALGLGGNEYLVVARPPAETAHYRSASSARLWRSTVEGLAERAMVRVVTMPRSSAQRHDLTRMLEPLRQVEILRDTVAGPELVSAADLVVGGGGTMNREAAVLGVPVWSVFSGPSPHIDECLAREGRLRWVRSELELADALRDDPPPLLSRRGPFPGALELMVRDIEERL